MEKGQTDIQNSQYSPMMEKPHLLGSSVCLLDIGEQRGGVTVYNCTRRQDLLYTVCKEEELLYVTDEDSKLC